MPLITGTTLKNIVPTLALSRAIELADDMDFILPKYGIDTPDILEEFIPNLAHESVGFRLKCENLNYRTPERIVAVWPSRFTTQARLKELKHLVSTSDIRKRAQYKTELEKELKKDLAEAFTGRPEKLANKVYGGRMGNTLPNDGWDFRGGGFPGLTGRDVHEEYAKYWATDPYKIAQMIRTDDYWALDCAAWFFAIKKNLLQLAIQDKFIPLVEKWNGGLIGLHDRQYYYERAKRYLR